ncbi:Carbon storage regulator [Posidoniimonas polymericola]|uniref:Translational regulator CsrA n=1 Tax=Posidoniimonas polymericola TaxID=2528002 RepID=A0A5C5YKS7_9BACT|nr:carbon storage regulator [Posidoniimonas polymericola]TWT75476.1 Carbon storage regulator [Posidoniimonas polymericola]
MLVLSRKIGERLLIGDQVVVTVVKAGPGGVRLGIEAPANMPVVREELAEQIAAEEELRRQDAAALDIDPEAV